MSDSYIPDNEPRYILLSLEELASKKLPHAPTFRKAADEITRLRADLAAVTAERDRMREALKPFSWPASAMYEAIHGREPSDKIINVLFKIGDMRRARAALEGVTEPASPWRDIESAPKDGTLIQVWRKNRNVVTAYWVKNQSCWKNPNIEIPALYDPTHWMPLPEPPR